MTVKNRPAWEAKSPSIKRSVVPEFPASKISGAELAAAQPLPTAAARAWTLALTTVSFVLAGAAGYLASARPDVLEAAAARFGLHERALYMPPFAGYESAFGGPWLIALAGVGAVFLCGWVLLRALARR